MKDTYYFSHDYNPTSDPKIQALIGEHGAVGYGLYWRIVEMLHEEGTHKLPCKKYIYLALAKQMSLDVDTVELVIKCCIELCELFNSDGIMFWSERVLRNIGKRNEISTKRSEAGKRSAELRKSLASDEQNSTNVEQVSTSVQQNSTKERKVKEIKVKENKENKNKDNKENLPTNLFGDESKDEGKINKVELVRKLYNETFKDVLPSVIKITGKREKAVNAILKEFSIEKIKEAFDLVMHSDFLKGKTERKFACNFDWIFNSDNFVKILENKYKNREELSIDKKQGLSEHEEIYEGKRTYVRYDVRHVIPDNAPPRPSAYHNYAPHNNSWVYVNQ